MHDRRRFAALTAATLLAVSAAHAQDMSKFPDWSGQWRRPAGLAAAWDPTKPPGPGQQAPLTLEYQAIFEATLKDRAVGGLTGDPTGLCLPHGLPRMVVAIFPVEFVVTPKITYYMTDYTTSRRIFTDGRDWPKNLLPSFNGYSIGKWIDTDGDGHYDLLEVETRGFKSPRTFEGSGLPLHRDGESIIKERIFLDKADKNLLHDEVTVIDHAMTRPWTVTRDYQREPGGEWDFVDCAENNPHVVIGNETYMLGADGFLMPTSHRPTCGISNASRSSTAPFGTGAEAEARVIGRYPGVLLSEPRRESFPSSFCGTGTSAVNRRLPSNRRSLRTGR